jgi:hypothetical protein
LAAGVVFLVRLVLGLADSDFGARVAGIDGQLRKNARAFVSALQAFASAALYDRWFTPPAMDMPTLRAENVQIQNAYARHTQ